MGHTAYYCREGHKTEKEADFYIHVVCMNNNLKQNNKQ